MVGPPSTNDAVYGLALVKLERARMLSVYFTDHLDSFNRRIREKPGMNLVEHGRRD